MSCSTPLAALGVEGDMRLAEEPRPLVRAEAVGVVLGTSPWRVYELARKGLIPSVRVGRSVRFDMGAIERFIAGGGTGSPNSAQSTSAA